MKRFLAFVVVWWGLCLPSLLMGQHDIQEVIELLNQGDFDKAQELLRNNLETDTEDIDSRLLLGTVSDYLGETDEAIRIWTAGLTSTDNDYALYMSIGELRLRQGMRGNGFRYVKGYIHNNTSARDSLEDKIYRTQQLNLAVVAFQKATDFYPYESDAWLNLANTYEQLGHHEMALRCWEHLNEVYPTHDEFKVKLGTCRLTMGHLLEAQKAFDAALKLNPRLHEAYAGLSEYWLEKGELEKAGECVQQAEFYKWLPSFANMLYSKENYQTYEVITNTEYLSEEDKITRLSLIAQLKEEKNIVSTEFLGAICWYHEDKADIEASLFDELAGRGLHGARLLHELAKNSEQIFTIHEAVKRLVRLRAPGTFDLLVALLPQDKQPFQHINIAEQMALLGDDRAILYLIKELNPSMVRHHKDKTQDFEDLALGEGMEYARQRAALALSAFNHPAAIDALKEGLRNENVNVYCSASLYKLTGEEKYLSLVENFIENKKDKALAQFFSRIDTKVAEKLTKKLN